jgi:predicted transcriptional regulator
MSTRANKHKLTHTVAARVEPELYREIESLADQERRPPGSLVRNILADWFKSRQQEEAA